MRSSSARPTARKRSSRSSTTSRVTAAIGISDPARPQSRFARALTRFPQPATSDSAGRIASARGHSSGVRFAWLARAIGTAMSVYVRLLVVTCRFRGGLTRAQTVLAFWHGANLTGVAAALRWRGDLPHASFSTRGFRGLVITTLLDRLGILALPLPPETDRAAARDLSVALARLARDGYSLAVTPDGPFGPPRVAKPGALLVARAAGLPLVPVAPGARPAVRLRRWDRHIIPLPFSSVWVAEGDVLAVDGRQRIGRAELDDLTARLNEVAEVTDARMRGDPHA